MEKGYINNPTTLEEAIHNAKFQCDNVSGWLYTRDLDCALIKARCLIEAIETALEVKKNLPSPLMKVSKSDDSHH